MKAALLLITILCPMVFCGGTDCPIAEFSLDIVFPPEETSINGDYLIEDWGECFCAIPDAVVAILEAAQEQEGIGGTIGVKCIDCELARNLSKEVDMTDDCCQGYMDILIKQTGDNSKLLGDSSYNNYKSLEPEQECAKCHDIKQLAYNTNCPLHKPQTCYLYGKSYKNAGYGNSGGLGYYPPEDSYYSMSNTYYNNYDYSMVRQDDYGYYGGHQQHECLLETMLHHITNVPNVCSPLASTCQECGYGEATGNNCPKCPESKYTTQDYDDLYKRFTAMEGGRDTYCDKRSQYDAAGVSTPTTETAGNTVATVGWVLIAISGVLFLVSIAFFMTGRSERKAAAENRMAGHGVIA